MSALAIQHHGALEPIVVTPAGALVPALSTQTHSANPVRKSPVTVASGNSCEGSTQSGTTTRPVAMLGARDARSMESFSMEVLDSGCKHCWQTKLR